MSFPPNMIFAEKEIAQAKYFFNIHRFESCITLCDSVEKKTSLPPVLEEVSFLRKLSTAYDSWDRFNFKTAIDCLIDLKDNPLLPQYGIKSRVEKNKSFLYKEKDSQYCY